MATINLGNIKFKWQGAYNGATSYTLDDVVSYNGSSYICIQASTGNLPTDTAYWEQMSQAGTNGTDLSTTLTTEGDMLYRDGSGLQRLAKGTANQTLQMNGGATAPTWVTADSGNTVKLGQVLPSADTASSITFDNLFDDTTYQHYYISWDNVSLHSDSSEPMYMRFINNSGSEATGSSYRYGSLANYYGGGGGTTHNNSGWNDDKIQLFADNISLTADNSRGWNGLIYIRQPRSTTHRAEIQGFTTGDDGSGQSGWNSTIHGYLNNSDGITIRGFKIYTANAQNFAGGSRWTLYGVKL